MMIPTREGGSFGIVVAWKRDTLVEASMQAGPVKQAFVPRSLGLLACRTGLAGERPYVGRVQERPWGLLGAAKLEVGLLFGPDLVCYWVMKMGSNWT